jgi:polysaccharide deacetylase family protein (PEP-CTERM system associated)
VTHAFTIDLEEWFHGIDLPEEQWPSQSRLEVGLDRLMALLDRHGVKATFFVLGVVAQRHPKRVAELAAAGHELGCHGDLHRFVYRQEPVEFREDLRRAMGRIGDAVGVAPRGYRAPYFSIRRDSLWALDVLAEEGFAYDASIFPVRNYRYGMPDAPTEPHDRVTKAGVLRELPMTPTTLLGRNLPFSGGAYLRILPWWAQRLAWRSAEREGKRMVAYIHPWELDPDHPRIALPRKIAATHYARLGLTERRLGRLFSTHRFGRLDHVFAVA